MPPTAGLSPVHEFLGLILDECFGGSWVVTLAQIVSTLELLEH